MSINFRPIAVIVLLAGGAAMARAGDPGLIEPEIASSAPAVADASPVDHDGSLVPPVPPAPDGTGETPMAPGISPVPANIVSPSPAPVSPPPRLSPSPTPSPAVAGSACPYCGDPNCRRNRRSATCCERIKAGLYMHFGRGAPGYVYTPVPPAGSRLHAVMGWQISGGQAALQVLYDYDFVHDGAALSVRGHRQLWKVAQRAMRNAHPVIIEATPYRPELGRQRLEAVVAELARLDLPIAPERVIVAHPPGRPLEGDELPLLHAGFLGLGNLGPGAAGPPSAGAGPGANP